MELLESQDFLGLSVDQAEIGQKEAESGALVDVISPSEASTLGVYGHQLHCRAGIPRDPRHCFLLPVPNMLFATGLD